MSRICAGCGDRMRGSAAATAIITAALLWPESSRAIELNLAAVSCAKYENELLAASLPGFTADPIDTVMWLFGFSVATSGERVMYGDSLPAFGFALDVQCKNNPTISLLEALTAVKSKRNNPMDLTRLDCAAFEKRHAALHTSDPDSAGTLTMWLFGFAVGMSGSHVLDPAAVGTFDTALTHWCAQHPEESVFDALGAPNPAVPGARSPKPGGRR